MKVEYECDDCNGTGVYSGMCEGDGHAVVCLGCSGSGKAEFTYKPFTGRKKAKGIRTVSLSNGRFILDAQYNRNNYKVSYADFLKGKLSEARK
jgi:hypothetical protein